jgi:hypothetical protein
MLVLCCPVNLHPETAESLRLHTPDADIIDVGKDNYAYWRAMSERWGTTESLVIVEHDISFTGEQLKSFEDCPEPWCVFSYPHPDAEGLLDHSLGFTRFRAELMTRVSAGAVGRGRSNFPPPSMPMKIHWNRLDGLINETLRRNCFKPHVHGQVKHYH